MASDTKWQWSCLGTTDTNDMIKVLPPKTAEEVVARERERKARTTFLMALPEDHLAKFHKMADAKEIWKAIKSRFDGNDESKKMQTYFLKQQFKGFSVSASEGLHKGSLPSSWSQVALIMRTKPGLDTLSFDDLYNNLRVFEHDVKSTTASSSSNIQNVAFVSANNTSSTNDVSTAYSVSSYNEMAGGHDFHEDQKVSQEDRRRNGGYNGNKARDNSKRPAYQDDSKALVTINGEAVDWSRHVEEDTQNFAMMAYSFGNSGSDNEVQSCSKTYAESYARLKKLYDEQRDKLGDASVEITAYTLALKKVEAQLLSDESDSKHVKFASSDSDSSVETTTSMLAPVDNEPKIACEPKVWSDAPIIEEYESDSDDDLMENVKETGTPNHFLKVEKQDRHSHTRKGLGYARKSCFVCGSFSHLIRDCDFHEKRMAKQTELAISRTKDDPHKALKDKEIIDSGCSRHMTGNKAYLADYQEFKGGFVAFGGSNGKITGKGTIKAGRKESNTRRLVRPRQFSWVYFLKSKDETTLILNDFIRQAENQVNHKVKTIRSDNETKFKNHDLIELCGLKGIKREYSNTKTPQQNGVAERKNTTLIEAARTMLADSFSPTTFWAEAFNTACYVLNRVLVTKPQNKTPYELLTGRQPIITYLRPFGCHVTILNTIDQLGKFDGKSYSGFLIGYSLNSKAFRVYNLETKRVEENLHVNFLENKPNVARKGHAWIFDLDYLTNSMNYKPVSLENQANKSAGPQEANNSAGTQATDDQGANSEEIDLHDEHFVLSIWFAYSTTVKSLEDKLQKTTDCKTCEKPDVNTNSTNLFNVVSAPVSAVGPSRALNDDKPSYSDDPLMPHLEDMYASPSVRIFTDSSYDDEGVITEFNNLETTMNVSPTPTTRIHTIHPKTQILGDPLSAVQTRSKVHKNSEANALISQALEDKSWVDAMQEELLQFQIQKVWILIDLLFGKKAIGTKWVYKNKKDERGVIVRNKARLVAQGHRQEEGIYYDEFFSPVARIEAIRIFLAFASYMGFIVYQMNVKSAFVYDTIDKEVYVTQPPGFVDPKFPNTVYKVVKALYGLHQAPRAWHATLSTFLEKSGYRRGAIDKTLFIKQDKKDIMLVQVYVDDIIFGSTKKSWCDEFEELMKNWFQMSSMGELTFFLGLQVKQKEDGIFISQDKYVAEILKKFDFLSVRAASTLIEIQKNLVKDDEAADVDVTPKTSHLQAVKRIFRYLKGQPKLGLWYPKVSSFDLEAYSDSDYASVNLDKKSTTGGCQFLGRRLISWQYKKLTIMATFTTKVEYVAAAHCCGQVLWIQNQLLETMASSIICLATNQKFNFSRYILLSLVKNIEAGVPFYMFLRVITPLFENILVPAAEEVGQAQDDVSILAEPSTFKPHKKHKSKKQQPIAPKVPSPEPSPEHQLPLPSNYPIPDVDKDRLKLQELIDFCTRLSNKVLDLESEVIDIKFSFTGKIEKLEDRDKEESFKQGKMIADMDEDVEDIDEEELDKVEEVLEVVTAAKLMTKVVTTVEPTTTAAQVPKASASKRRRGVIIQDPEETTTSVIVHIELEAELNANINWNDVIDQVKRSERQNNEVLRYQALKRKHLNEAQEMKNMEISKKQKIDEEIEELKRHLQIVANDDDDDVYTKATPLASKVHVVEYQIHHEKNKPYYKIIRANGTHKLFLSFITLLKNFDREDLETLWKLVKESFETTEPKNFLDDFLLNILKIMFEKLNVEANMFLLVEKKYPLKHFTLEQMLNNVRLEVKEESDMSLELLSLKALDEGCSSKNYIRKFLKALHPKWRSKVTTIEESKDLTLLSLNELIRNLKVKKESSDEESSTFGSEEEEYAMAVKDFKKFFKRSGRECLKPSKDKSQRAFFKGSLSDSGEKHDERIKMKHVLRLKYLAIYALESIWRLTNG
uniref:Integrase catalytic domain-containing protein n=1 Tax=Tanacetum cinerariifolium TaxID=118510 RepID=A0A6L2JAX1_TANCI|nr:hypothetical protein [Tanacetum cinerariifolium]